MMLSTPIHSVTSTSTKTSEPPTYQDVEVAELPVYKQTELPPLHTYGTLGLYHTSRSDYYIAPHARPRDARLFYVSTVRGMKQPHIRLHPGTDATNPAVATAMIKSTGPEVDLAPSTDPKVNFPAGPGRKTQKIRESGILKLRRSFFLPLTQPGKDGLESEQVEVKFEWRRARESPLVVLRVLGLAGSAIECVRADTNTVVAFYAETAIALNKIGSFRMLEEGYAGEALERMVLMSLLCVVEEERRDGVAIYDASANVLASAGPTYGPTKVND